VLPTVSGVDPTLTLRTKPIFELTDAHSAALQAGISQYPSVFSAVPSVVEAAAAATAAGPGAASVAAPAASASVPKTVAADETKAAFTLSASLENACDLYNQRTVQAAVNRAQQLGM
jgi:hypothetical protein